MKPSAEMIDLLEKGFDFEHFLNTHINGVLAIQEDGSLLSADHNVASLLGYNPAQLPGMSIQSILPGLELPAPGQGEPLQGQAVALRKDKKEISVSYTIRQGKEEEGRLIHYLLLHRESSIAQSLELYTHMFEWMPVGILVYNLAQNKPVACNRELLRLFGAKTEEEFILNGPFSASPQTPQTFEKLEQQLSRFSREKRSEFNIEVTRAGAPPLSLQVTTALIPALNESLILLLFQDVTQKRKTTLELEQSQKTLEAVINTAVDGIIIIDERGIIQMANQAASGLFGYEKEEMQGQNVSILMPAPHQKQHDGYLSNYLHTGMGKIIGVGREVEGLRKDGGRFPFKLGVSRVELEGKILFAGVIHDLTEQKRAEARILHLNKELEQKVEERTEKLTEVVNKLLQSNIKLEREIKERKAAEAALRQNQEELRRSLEKEKELSELKSRFVSMASHEFRTPLTTIASSAELLGLYTQSEQQEKRDKHLRRIQSAVTNLTGILGDFLSLSKLEEGKIQVNPVRFTLSGLVEEVVEEMHSLLKPGQKILTDCASGQAEVVLDKKILKNIFINLLSNAIKYSAENSTVYFQLAQDGRRIDAVIRDEGIGIPREDQKHLFTRFFRAANSVNIQGTGLGLNIVKRYTDLLGGTIRFESEEGKGTTFFVELTWQDQ
ncbi:MAG: PAS domain S-box protein [Lewinellaceae bacterium]|nr:PAS domain S-box protein [Lewinellaceae bacterium]